MNAMTHSVEQLSAPVSERDLQALAALLVEAVETGAAVSFLAPLSPERAVAWWRRSLTHAPERAVVLAARDEAGTIVGTVQLQPAWAPNQPHRAEVVKLLVAAHCRGAGLGRRLMQEIERLAVSAGFSLLTLDAKRGAPAEQLDRSLGWIHAGTIPAFALDTDGATPHDAVVYYKPLGCRG